MKLNIIFSICLATLLGVMLGCDGVNPPAVEGDESGGCADGTDNDQDGTADCDGDSDQLPNGSSGCAALGDDACLSGHCSNDVCCDAGDCCATEQDCPAAYSSAAACSDVTGTTECQGSRRDAACSDYVCVTAAAEDDSGCAGLLRDCPNDLAAVVCGSAVDQPVAACADTCGENAPCRGGYACDQGVCTALAGAGEVCTGVGVGACLEGLKCENDLCCDEDAATCCSDSASCTGDLLCDATTYTCFEVCNDFDDSRCAAPAVEYCLDNACVPKLAEPAVCQDHGECLTGYCVEGVCCDGACDSACGSCTTAGNGVEDGVCHPVPAGQTDTLPQSLCTVAGFGCDADSCACDGDGVGAQYCGAALGQSCVDAADCVSGACECIDVACAARECVENACGACEYSDAGTCTPMVIFPDSTGAAGSSLIESAIVAVPGSGCAGAISIAGGGGEYRICDDANCTTVDHGWSSAAGDVDDSQYVQLRITSSGDEGATVSTTVDVAGLTDQWSVTTLDDTPDAFDFADQVDVAFSTLTASDIVQVTGISDPAALSVSGGGTPEHRICADATCSGAPAYTAAAGSATNGEYVQLRLTSSAAEVTVVSATLTVGTVSDQWDVTSGDTTPEVFDFTDATSAARSSVITSDSLTIAGISLPAAVSIVGGGSPEFSISGGAWGTTGNITGGQSVQVRLTTSAAFNTLLSATLDIGGVTDVWNVTTIGCVASSQTFNYVTAATQDFEVPAGCTTINVTLKGAGGGRNTSRPDLTCPNAAAGGAGGLAVYTALQVTGGETLQILVGGKGADGVANQASSGGYGGGGSAQAGFPRSGGGGGGRSAVIRTGTDLVTAAGGGGATGCGTGYTGGAGGGTTGNAGGAPDGGQSAAGGGPSTGGTGSCGNGGGGSHQGGSCTTGNSGGSGGGGGGGHYGGAGAVYIVGLGSSGAGGGSSFVPVGGTTTTGAGSATSTHGQVVISWGP